jgi:two-component system, OmpR family, sensor kinase
VPAVVHSSHAAAPDPEWLVNQIAHALRNPIFAATVQAEALALKARSSDELLRSAAMVQGQLKRLADDIEEMLLLGRQAHLNPRATDLVAVARGVADSFRRGVSGDAASVELRGADAVPFHSDPDAIRIILERLLRNAVQHTEPPHEVELEVAAAADGAASVSVRDRGAGMAPELLEKVFLPFFPQHRGRPGLGLAVAAKLAHALGGSIEISSEPGAGTTARLMLPPAPPAAGP